MKGGDRQEHYLITDRCLLVNTQDSIIGSAPKLECHTGKGSLHRAFSVLLFDNSGRMLLQQRAATKPTFPMLWTNTCCSHPLADIPGESEASDGVGVRRAAVRKLQQELGIPASQIPLESVRLATRILYRARQDDLWVEHEIDSILLFKGPVDLVVNADEVAAVHYVTQSEMRRLMEENRQSRILSPWFAAIAEQFLFSWWDILLSGDASCIADDGLIHEIA